MKTEAIRVRLEETDKTELDDISTALDVPSSQIVREAIREKITELKRTHPRLIGAPETETALAK